MCVCVFICCERSPTRSLACIFQRFICFCRLIGTRIVFTCVLLCQTSLRHSAVASFGLDWSTLSPPPLWPPLGIKQGLVPLNGLSLASAPASNPSLDEMIRCSPPAPFTPHLHSGFTHPQCKPVTFCFGKSH